MAELVCPGCGSKNVNSERRNRTVELGDDLRFEYLRTIDRCLECETAGDFLNSGIEAYDQAHKEAVKKFVENLAAELARQEIKMVDFERIFGLSKRTFNRWKRGNVSAGSLALLRLVNMLPLTIDFAESGFSKNESLKKMREYVLANRIDFNNVKWKKNNSTRSTKKSNYKTKSNLDGVPLRLGAGGA